MADVFMFLPSYYEAIQMQKKQKDRLLLYEAVCEYGIKGNMDVVNQYSRELREVDGLISDYDAYARKNGGNTNLGIIIDLPVKTADGSETEVQSDINSWTLEGLIKMYADATGVQADLNSMNFTAYANVIPTSTLGTGISVDGSHAGGLDFVPRDGYLARLHYGEAVLNRNTADMLRSGGMGDTSRLEAMISQVVSYLSKMSGDMGSGQQIVLDTGVLVGQITPAIDKELGTIMGRKWRRA